MPESVPVLHEPITTPAGIRRFFREIAPWQQIRWGTERVERLLEYLVHPEQAMRFVIVGGTNAKGSTTLYLAALLRALGLRVGATLSPHVSDLTERIHLNGSLISVPALIAACERVRLARLAWPAGDDSTPTYHELWTTAAIEAFAQSAMEWGILEVGMGGRFDAARAVPSDIAIITPIGLDHMQFLGDTIEKIAIEKAEIVTPGGLLISAPQVPDAESVLRAKTEAVGATWLALDREVTLTLAPGPSPIQPSFAWSRAGWELQALVPGLAGRFQVMNAAVALLAVHGMYARGVIARLPNELEVQTALASVTSASHPARFERLSLDPEIWCEGGHNPPALQAFVQDFALLPRSGPLELLLGFKWDKDVEQALTTLAALNPARLTITESHQAEPRPAGEIADIARAIYPALPIVVEPDLRTAAQRWQQHIAAAPGAVGLVIGSLYLAGDVRRLIAQGALGPGPWLMAPLQLPESD